MESRKQLKLSIYFFLKNIIFRIVGIYDNNTPAFMVRDPEIIKKIAVKDFDHFANHRTFLDPESSGLSGLSLFLMQNQKWKDMRSTLSPAFTGTKIRLMFDLIQEISQQSISFLKNSIALPMELDMKDFFTRFTNDAIASSAFGMKADSLKDRENTFFKMGKSITNPSILLILKFFILFNFKQIFKFLKLSLFKKEYDEYFIRIVSDSMKFRKENNIIRHDLINILMEAKENSEKWTIQELTAQCFLFFFAGFESVSTTLSFAAFELMANPNVQRKLIREIDETKRTLNGRPLTYENLKEMKYLDAVVNETLRKWPVSPVLDRVCDKDYVIRKEDGSEILIKKGEPVFIPVAGIHYDPIFYSNPEFFDPERFLGNTSSTNNFNYMPFGVGPRKCIASLFALMETKLILYQLLSNFSFRKGKKAHIPMILEANLFQIKPKHGFWIELHKNNSKEHDIWMNI